MVTGFASLLIVIPLISSNQSLFGIYMYVTSLTLYFSYSDIGFLSSGQKFANEEYAKGNYIEEGKILGFVFAVLITFFIPFSIFLLYISSNPDIAFNNLEPESFYYIKNLLLITAVLTPIQIIFQRIITTLYAIRLKDFVVTRIEIVANLIKLISVFYFFDDSKYMLIEYLIFVSILSITVYILCAYLSLKNKDFNIFLTLKSVKLSKKYFLKTKDLAFSSFALTLAFILYYELDLIIIGKIFGPYEIAIYASAFTLINFLRSLWAIVFSPFQNHINHHIGDEDFEKARNLIKYLITYSFPLYFAIMLSLLIFSDEFILYWVGADYLSSVIILKSLSIMSFMGFIVIPANIYMQAFLKIKYMYLNSIILPVVFYSILFTLYYYNSLEIWLFAHAKTITIFISACICLIAIRNLVRLSSIIVKWLIPSTLITIYFQYAHLITSNSIFIDPQKNFSELVIFLVFISLLILTAFSFIILVYKKERKFIISSIRELMKK